jgi:uncharacterized protein
MRAFVRLCFFFCLFFSRSLFAERVIPRLTGPVMDEAGFLSSSERSNLDQLLRSYEPVVQIQIWTLNSLEGEPIEGLSIRAVDTWKLGAEKKDNGVLILVSEKDRRMRIEVGRGLEGDIPDALAGRMIDQVLKPSFRAGKFFEGLEAVSTFIYKKLSHQEVKEPKKAARGGGDIWIFIILFLLFGFLHLMGFRGGRGSGTYYGWGGGGSGGGGWSGGGGGFSGGGASGDW